MTPTVTSDQATEGLVADRDLVVLFAKSLRLLGQAGHPVAANRLAAKAWWTLKDGDPKGANRISGVMHYLAGLPEESGAEDDGPRRTPMNLDTETPTPTDNTGVT